MELIDLAAQYDRIGSAVRARIARVFEHGRFVLGPEVQELEERLAAMAGVRHCIGCSSGTDALSLMLLAHGIGPGDAVFVPAFTFFATAEAVMLTGATPLFVDIDPGTCCMSSTDLERRIAASRSAPLRPRMVIGVDLYGVIADYSALGPICARHNLALIEDAAQSFGAGHQRQMSCSFGNGATTSFYPAKPLGGYGEGGALFTGNTDLADHLRSLRSHGYGDHPYDHRHVGMNARLDTLQAAALCAKLDIFEDELRLRRERADTYRRALKGICQVQTIPAAGRSSWAQFTIQVDARDAVRAFLQARGIPAAVHYPLPVPLQPACACLGQRAGEFPASEAAAARVLSLPLHPYLCTADQERVIEGVMAAVQACTNNRTDGSS